MSFPNVKGKHAHKAMFGPLDFISYLRKQGLWNDFRAPDGVVFFYQRWLLDKVVAQEAASGHLRPDRTPAALLSFHLVNHDNTTIGLSGGFGIGSPAAVAVMEELIAVGVNQFIGIGTAGGLQKDLPVGSVVVCDRAVRDEGVSHHYVEPAKYAHTSSRLTQRLKDTLGVQGLDPRVGTTWTIDAPYRETVEELKQYQAEGVLTVDMEAAAMASVATYRRVEFAAPSPLAIPWPIWFGTRNSDRPLSQTALSECTRVLWRRYKVGPNEPCHWRNRQVGDS